MYTFLTLMVIATTILLVITVRFYERRCDLLVSELDYAVEIIAEQECDLADQALMMAVIRHPAGRAL